MKLFGSKDNEEQEDVFAEETGDEGFDTAETGALDDTSGSGALSAPSRDIGGGRKSKKGLLFALLALLLAGGGGGAYYFMMMMEEPAPAPRVAKMLGDTPQKPADMIAPVPAQIDVTAAVVGEAVPPMPEAPEVPEGLADIPPAFPPQTQAETAVPSAIPGAQGGVPAAPSAMPEDFTLAADPLAAMGAPPVDDIAVPVVPAPQGAAEAPSVADASPAAAAAAPAAPVPAEEASGPDMPANALADAFAPVSAPTAESAATAPKEDLPMPRLLETPAPAAQTAGTAPADVSNAEKAIVENAAVLNQLSAPAAATAADPAAAGRTVNEILGQPAIVRPMPDSYVVVRKEKDGGALDARLKTARSALIQNRDMAALQLFTELQQDYPRDVRVGMGRALAMQKLGQYDQALAAYEDVLGNDPKNLEALTNMLGILKVQNPELALEKLIELREAYPFNADIAAQLGVSYAGMQSYAEALKYFDMADALRPGNAYVMYNRAVLYDRMGNEEKAASLYRQIVRMASEGALREPIPLDAIHRRLSNMR